MLSCVIFPPSGAVDERGQMPYYAEECASMLAVTFSSGSLGKRNIVSLQSLVCLSEKYKAVIFPLKFSEHWNSKQASRTQREKFVAFWEFLHEEGIIFKKIVQNHLDQFSYCDRNTSFARVTQPFKQFLSLIGLKVYTSYVLTNQPEVIRGKARTLTLTPNTEFLRIFFPRGQNPPKP